MSRKSRMRAREQAAAPDARAASAAAMRRSMATITGGASALVLIVALITGDAIWWLLFGVAAFTTGLNLVVARERGSQAAASQAATPKPVQPGTPQRRTRK